MHMMRKGQVKRLSGNEAQGQAKFVASLFGIAAPACSYHDLLWLKPIFAMEPFLVVWKANGRAEM